MSNKRPNLLDRQNECIGDIKNFELTKSNDGLTIDRYVEENLNIGGADLLVYKLLGVHEQGVLIDIAKDGRPISAGDGTNFPSSNVYDQTCGSWRSKQKGPKVKAESFIGYDFGPIRDAQNDREIYGVETYISKHITTIVLTQGPLAETRASRVRIERSMDGITWKGVDIIDTPNDSEAHTYHIKGSSASRYWRLRPVEFNGELNWEIKELKLMEYEKTSLSNIQDDMGFLESRDRDYASDYIEVKAAYDLLDTLTTVNAWGSGPATQNLYFMMNFTSCVRKLGRPMVVGDVFELPSEVQYTAELRGIPKYMEVTDVAWSTEGYTPGWTPTMLRVVAEPMLSTQETMDITGHTYTPTTNGFLNIDDSDFINVGNIDDRIHATADTNVPERGEDTYDRAVIDESLVDQAAEQGVDIAKLGLNQRRLYVEDAMPPNAEPYTENDVYPANPKDGDWHRLTYKNIGDSIPPRLFRWSDVKGRWIYCETDRRQKYNRLRPGLQNIISSDTATPTSNITGADR